MIIIPARAASSRFPKKVLADIGGLPMVVRTAKMAQSVDEVIVATDDDEIMNVCTKHNIKAMMSDPNHSSGTERINEIAQKMGLKDRDIVINLQADEPFLESVILHELINLLKNRSDIFMASCYTHLPKEHASDPNAVKVVLDSHKCAIYFSRSVIPYDRDGGFDDYKLHLGLYGFYAATLKEYCHMSKSPLEDIEKLEQLRVIYHGKKIAMLGVETKSFGIDTPEDLQRAVKLFIG